MILIYPKRIEVERGSRFSNLSFVYSFSYKSGNHSYEYVKEDIEHYWKKIKKGGVLGGDDFNNGVCDEHDGVVKAVLEFVCKNNLKLYVGEREWWVEK